MHAWIRTAGRAVNDYLPAWVGRPVKSVGTALLAPAVFSLRTGHLRSSLTRAAVSRSGEPLPWYTYPSIDFLAARSYEGRTVLEFGAGQSTLWWAARAERVVALEGDPLWLKRVRAQAPPNVDLRLAPLTSGPECVASAARAVDDHPDGFDVVVIDGLYRRSLSDLAVRAAKQAGAVICDNAEGYGVQELFRDKGLMRVDFFGFTPGGVLPHCTSIFFRPESFLFDPYVPIPSAAVNL